MTQAAYSIPNQTAAALRLDLNNHLLAIVSQNSGATAPSVTFAYQFWADTGVTPPMLRQRNAANAAWIAIAQLSNFGLPSVQLQSATAATTTNVGVAYSATQTPPTSGAKLVDATINADNSGALSTLALNGDAAKSIKQYSSTGTKIAAVLVAGMRATLMDDGTDWILMNPLSTGAGAAGTGSDQTGYENDQLITGAFTVGQSAMTGGATISIATPAVVTLANTFVAGQPIRFTTTGTLPTGLVVNNQYFVSSAGLSTSSFQVAATQAAAVAGTGSVATSGTQSGVHSVGKCKDMMIAGGLRVASGASFTVPSGSKAVFL